MNLLCVTFKADQSNLLLAVELCSTEKSLRCRSLLFFKCKNKIRFALNSKQQHPRKFLSSSEAHGCFFFFLLVFFGGFKKQ